MNTCGLQDDIIMYKSCTDYIIVNKRVLTESACFKITNTLSNQVVGLLLLSHSQTFEHSRAVVV